MSHAPPRPAKTCQAFKSNSGNKDVQQAVITDKQTTDENVRGYVRKWRTIQNKTTNSYVIEILV
jgi:hypothetical protein